MTGLRAAVLFGLAAMMTASCVGAPGAPGTPQEPTFRVRADLAAPLNADTAWAGRTGEAATVVADRPFRLRLEAPNTGRNTGRDGAMALQVRRNGGAWEGVQAHDFPFPERELTVSFDDEPLGAVRAGWTLLEGEDDPFRVVEDGVERVLRGDGGEDGLAAIYALPWGASADVTVAARLRLHGEAASADIVFGVDAAGAGHAVRFSADGAVTVLQRTAGAETVLAEDQADLAPSAWRAVEVAAENGRLEIEIEGETVFDGALAAQPGAPGLAVRPGSRVDIAEITFEGVASTPQASIVSSAGYEPNAPTTDLLDGAAGPFSPGLGLSLSERARATSAAYGHSEYEWPLVIRRLSDGPTVSDDGDIFEFRMVDAESGAPIGPAARVVLSVPPGHLGGAYVETPGRIGPWQAANGDLYFIMEPSETDNKFMMMKSVDGGRTWRETDAANRPLTGDLEAVDARLVGDRIHIIHQITDSVHYHVFRTSDHPTQPDTWEIRDEIAADATALAQMATITPRSDGSLVSVFLADRLHFVVRSPDGVWSAPVALDRELERINAGPQAALGRADMVHIAYFTDDGRIWHRRLSPDGTLSARTLIAHGAGSSRAEYGAVLPLVYNAKADRLTIAYRRADGRLWERAIEGDAPPSAPTLITAIPVVTQAADSQQAGADLIAADGGLTALFIDEETRSLFSAEKTADGWSEPVLRAGGVDAAWVRGALITTRQGEPALAYVFDAGSRGGTGLNRFGRFQPASPHE